MVQPSDPSAIGTIFVQIASYRDPDLPFTLANLTAKARHPDRLHFGICLQSMPDDPPAFNLSACMEAVSGTGATLRVIEVDARESMGVCWARHRAQQLYADESFSLQIDSHMRAIEGWDDEAVAAWLACGDPDAVLSVYPNGFTLPDLLKTDTLPILAAHQFDANGILRLRGLVRFQLPHQRPEHPWPGAFISAGFLFGPGRLVATVPYDPHLYFYGEEITMAARLWTHGFNVYNPDRLLLFHLYKRSGHVVPTHWADHRDWSVLNRQSLLRAREMLDGLSSSSDPYGLGTERTLEQYQRWCGVDFSTQTIQPHALRGEFGAARPMS